VYADTVAINAMIVDVAPEGIPHSTPAGRADALVQSYWDLHIQRETVPN
jgi:hypothetical protein